MLKISAKMKQRNRIFHLASEKLWRDISSTAYTVNCPAIQALMPGYEVSLQGDIKLRLSTDERKGTVPPQMLEARPSVLPGDSETPKEGECSLMPHARAPADCRSKL